MSFESDWQRCRKAVEAALDVQLPSVSESPEKLHEAMRYATLDGGKRFRAVLLIMTGEMLGVDTEVLLDPAVAIECVHAYSLVHDDLPCMDDDQYRRGKLSCFAAYDEATAVLVGDALQTLAFEIIASSDQLNHIGGRRSSLISVLAKASGSRGMAGGQALDLNFDSSNADSLLRVHRLKTAKLIQASVRLGALAYENLKDEEYAALSEYGELIGLSFQYQDDVLDDEHDVEFARLRASELRDQAIGALKTLSHDTTNLQKIAEFTVERLY